MADKIDMLKSSYFLSGMNEKVYKSLCQLMDIRTHQFGDIIVDWGKPISKMYFVKDGTVKILRKKLGIDPDTEQIKESVFKSGQESLKTMRNVAKFLLDSKEYDEIAIREKNQTFGEEYFYLQTTTKFRAVVNSASATIVSIPFADMRKTFTTFEMYKQEMAETIVNKITQQKEWRRDIDVRLSDMKHLDSIVKHGAEHPISEEAQAAKELLAELPKEQGRGNKIVDRLDTDEELKLMEKRLDDEESKVDKFLTQKEKIQFANKISKTLTPSQVAQVLKGNHPLTLQLKWSPHKSKMLAGMRKSKTKERLTHEQLLEERCRRPAFIQSFDTSLPAELQVSTRSLNPAASKTVRSLQRKPESMKRLQLTKAASVSSRDLDQDDFMRRYPDLKSTSILKSKILAKKRKELGEGRNYSITKLPSNISSVFLGNTPRPTVFFTKDVSLDSVKPQQFIDSNRLPGVQPGMIEEAASPLFGSRHKPSVSEDMLRASFRERFIAAKHHASSVSTKQTQSRADQGSSLHYLKDHLKLKVAPASPEAAHQDQVHSLPNATSDRPKVARSPVVIAGISSFTSRGQERDLPTAPDHHLPDANHNQNDSLELRRIRNSRIKQFALGRIPLKPLFAKPSPNSNSSAGKLQAGLPRGKVLNILLQNDLVAEGNSLTAGWEGAGSKSKDIQFSEISNQYVDHQSSRRPTVDTGLRYQPLSP